MKYLVEDKKEDVLVSLLGEKVFFLCSNWHYYGRLVGVDDRYVQIASPLVVYEVGEWINKEWDYAESLPTKHLFIMIHSIESFLVVNHD